MSRLIYSRSINDRPDMMTETVEAKLFKPTSEEDYVIYIFSKYASNISRDRFSMPITWELYSHEDSSYTILCKYWKPTDVPDNAYDLTTYSTRFVYYEDNVSETIKTIMFNTRFLVNTNVSWLERKQKEESDDRKASTEGKKRKKTKIQNPAEVPESEQQSGCSD